MENDSLSLRFGGAMRGSDETIGSLFSYVDLEDRIPARHPLRKIRQIVKDALASLDSDFVVLYSVEVRLSIAPERLLRASLIQIWSPTSLCPPTMLWLIILEREAK